MDDAQKSRGARRRWFVRALLAALAVLTFLALRNFITEAASQSACEYVEEICKRVFR